MCVCVVLMCCTVCVLQATDLYSLVKIKEKQTIRYSRHGPLAKWRGLAFLPARPVVFSFSLLLSIPVLLLYVLSPHHIDTSVINTFVSLFFFSRFVVATGCPLVPVFVVIIRLDWAH